MDTTWISVKEAAQLLGRSEKTVRRYMEAGEIRWKQYVPRGAVYVLREDVEKERARGSEIGLSTDDRTSPQATTEE